MRGTVLARWKARATSGHSLGGLITARYAPGHQDRVKGLVLLDATIPELNAGFSEVVPTTAAKSGHYIYVDRPGLAVKAVRHVTAQAGDDPR